MAVRCRRVPVSEIMAHPTKSLRAKDYLPDEVPVSILPIETGYVMVTEDSSLFNPARKVMVPREFLKRYQKYSKERESIMKQLKSYLQQLEDA
jgi:hypothetical protein